MPSGRGCPCVSGGGLSPPFSLEIAMSSWGCPHEIKGLCSKVNDLVCNPGMKGCELAGRYFFVSSEDKNKRLQEKQARAASQQQKQ